MKLDIPKTLAMSEEEQRTEIAKRLSPKPWKHIWRYENAVGGMDNIATGDVWSCEKCGHEETYSRKNSGQFIPAVLDKKSPKCKIPNPIQESLADLAFRLRDEAVRKSAYDWTSACVEVFREVCTDWPERNFDVWWQDNSQPIHWILSALMAKEKK